MYQKELLRSYFLFKSGKTKSNNSEIDIKGKQGCFQSHIYKKKKHNSDV